MHIIIAYDVEAKHTEKFKKICQIYLTRVQNSVFEGDIEKADLMRLTDSLRREAKENETIRVWITSRILDTIRIGISKDLENGII
ncbi:CRISPR-associated endonuclease Cas2 [Oxyplasma meridianum]|uniref:CRISPR-associated endoribonuclease Cas2 n=1 Tax=Oxyplasma meridianum TaxID=3073602 RepID=A0AAX4NDX0_9ARCH